MSGSTPLVFPGPLRALLFFALGIRAADALWFGPGLEAGSPFFRASLAAASLFCVLVLLLPRPRRTLFPLFLVLAGFLRAGLPLSWARDLHMETLAGAEAVRTMTALVERVEPRASGRYRVRLRLLSVAADTGAPRAGHRDAARSVRARALASWPETLDPPEPDDRVTFRGVVRYIHGPTNPGEWNQRLHFERQGIRYRFSPERNGSVIRTPGPALSLENALEGLRAGAGAAVDARMDGFARRLTRVLLIGDRVSFLPEEEEDFRRAGVVHVLSVSGLHVGLVAATIQLLLGRKRRPGALILSFAGVWGYTLLVGAPSAAVRSAAMLSLVLAARNARRVVSGVPLLASASLIVLAASPGLLFDLGFLLSVFSVAGLLTAHRTLAAIPRLATAPTAVRAAASAIGLTFGAQAATAPFVIPLWGDWPLVAPLANLLVVGVSDLVLTGGLMALAVDLFHTASADRIFAVVWGLARFVGYAVHELAAHSPGLTGLRPPPPFVPWAFGGTAIAAVLAFQSGRRRAGAACVLAWLVTLTLLVAAPAAPPAGLRVTVIDVGQGDATLLEFPDGRTLLVDGGPGGSAKTGERTVRGVMRAARITRLDAMVLSHEHLDHQGGLAELINLVPVGGVFDSGLGPEGGMPGRFRELCAERGVAICLVAAGDTIATGPGYSAVVLWPPRPADPADDYDRPANVVNNLSLVMLVTWRGRSILLCGDLEAEGEEDLLHGVAGPPPPGPVDVLKAGHHGSRTSSGEAWLDHWKPGLAAMSCGRNNRFRHPSPEIVERYVGGGIALHRTDTGGALRVTLFDNGILFERFGDGRFRPPRRGFVRNGDAWPRAFLDASGSIW